MEAKAQDGTGKNDSSVYNLYSVYSFVDLLTLASGFSHAAGENFLGFMTCCWNSLGPASALELAVFWLGEALPCIHH